MSIPKEFIKTEQSFREVEDFKAEQKVIVQSPNSEHRYKLARKELLRKKRGLKMSQEALLLNKKRICDYEYNLNLGRWTPQEDLIYANYLADNLIIFETEYQRRTQKVFEKLSELLDRKRSSQQCRSHHQKMQLAAGDKNVREVIKYVKQSAQKKLDKRNKREMIQRRHQIFRHANDNQSSPIDAPKDKECVITEYRLLKISINFDNLEAW